MLHFFAFPLNWRKWPQFVAAVCKITVYFMFNIHMFILLLFSQMFSCCLVVVFSSFASNCELIATCLAATCNMQYYTNEFDTHTHTRTYLYACTCTCRLMFEIITANPPIHQSTNTTNHQSPSSTLTTSPKCDLPPFAEHFTFPYLRVNCPVVWLPVIYIHICVCVCL